ncbi:hypothetical protein M8494_12165 [Serratia ureilytica]
MTGAAAWPPADAGEQELYRTAHSVGDHRAYLRAKGFQVEPKTNLATVITRNAMINKQIDMTWNTPAPR